MQLLVTSGNSSFWEAENELYISSEKKNERTEHTHTYRVVHLVEDNLLLTLK